jgi:hypothetical protein
LLEDTNEFGHDFVPIADENEKKLLAWRTQVFAIGNQMKLTDAMKLRKFDKEFLVEFQNSFRVKESKSVKTLNSILSGETTIRIPSWAELNAQYFTRFRKILYRKI